MKRDLLQPHRSTDFAAAVFNRYAVDFIHWIIAGSLILVAAAVFLSYAANDTQPEVLKIHTARGVHTFIVEIADSAATRSKGLMHRTHLTENAGMLFRYGKPRELRMWMKNTPLSLDMIFIRKDGIVHRVEARTQPFSETVIFSRGDVIACLEVLGGTAEHIGLKGGDRIEHKSFGM